MLSPFFAHESTQHVFGGLYASQKKCANCGQAEGELKICTKCKV